MTLPFDAHTAPAMIVLRPGDKVLLTVNEDMPEDQAADMVGQLHDVFDGVDFVVMSGVVQMAVSY